MEVSTNYSRDFDHIFGILPMGKYLSKVKELAFFRTDDLTSYVRSEICCCSIEIERKRGIYLV